MWEGVGAMTETAHAAPPEGALVEEISLFPDRRTGRPAIPLTLAFSRPLVAADAGRALPPAPAPTLQKLRARHHMVARLLAEGRRPGDVAAIVGYNRQMVTLLQADPAFQQLVAFYSERTDAAYVGVHERLAVLGTTAAEVLQDRLEESPQAFTNKDLRELMGEAYERSVAPAKGPRPGAGGPAAVSVNISFVSSPQGAAPVGVTLTGEGPIVEGIALAEEPMEG